MPHFHTESNSSEYRKVILIVLCAIVAGVLIVGTTVLSRADDGCPDGQKCKVLYLTPQEENALTMPRGVFDSAENARYLDLSGVVKYFREKLLVAKTVEGKKTEAPKEEKKDPKK